MDELWASHHKKLEAVHWFLVEEPYWSDVEPPDSNENASYLGTIKSWSGRHDRSKQRGFYVNLGKTGEVLAPSDVADEDALREVIARVLQIGWQLRLGEHIEGKHQDEKEVGLPAMSDDELAWLPINDDDADDDLRDFQVDLRRSMKEGIPGETLPNVAYRFNPLETDPKSIP